MCGKLLAAYCVIIMTLECSMVAILISNTFLDLASFLHSSVVPLVIICLLFVFKTRFTSSAPKNRESSQEGVKGLRILGLH